MGILEWGCSQNFRFLDLVLKVSRTSLKIDDNVLEARRKLMFLTESRVIDHDLDQLGLVWCFYSLNFNSLQWVWRCQELSWSMMTLGWKLRWQLHDDCGWSHDLDQLVSLSWSPSSNVKYLYWVSRCHEPSWRIIKLFWKLGGCGGSWMGLGSLINIWISWFWYDEATVRISALKIEYEGVKDPPEEWWHSDGG